MKVLYFLVENRHRPVSREEILEHVWPGVYVSDGALSTAIYEARNAVGDDGRRQGMIRTLRGRGFRFVGEVKEIDPDTAELGSTPDGSGPDRHPQPFVGRGDILASLHAAWQAALLGSGRMVLLEGGAGIGKTSALNRFAEGLEGEAVFFGRFYEGRGAPPFWPWAQILRDQIRQLPESEVRRDLGSAGKHLVELVPELRSVLPDCVETAADGLQARFLLFDAIATFLRARAAARPLCLILDDLHWGDRPSLLLLEYLVTELASAPLLLIGTYRDEELDDGHPMIRTLAALARAPHCQRLTLSGLREEEVCELVKVMSGETTSPELLRAVLERTEGNPLFIKEIVGLMADGRDVPEQCAVPRAVREVIDRRLGRLAERTRETLRAAAVIGRDFGLQTLATVLDEPQTGLLETLDEAVAARILTKVPGSIGQFRFAHVLIREALYDRLGEARRSSLHRRIAESMARHVAADPGPHCASLAHHFFEAIPAGIAPLHAAEYCAKAGARARAVLAWEEAARHYAKALQALEWEGKVPTHRRCELVLALGEAQTLAGELQAARATFLSAVDTARSANRPDLLARAALGSAGPADDLERAVARHDAIYVEAERSTVIALLDEALHAVPPADRRLRPRLLACLGRELCSVGQQADGMSLAQEALELAGEASDAAVLGDVVSARREVLCAPEDVEERLAMANQVVDLAAQIGDRQLALRGRVWRLVDSLELADMNAVRRELEICSAMAEELRQPHYLHMMTVLRGTLALLRGRFDETERLAHAALQMGTKLEKEYAVAFYFIQMIGLRREQGRLQEIEGALMEALAIRPDLLIGRYGLAYALGEMGRLDEARRHFDTLARNDFQDVPRDRSWLTLITIMGNLCCKLEDRRRAAITYDLLMPCAGRNVVTAEGLISYGSASHQLGMLAGLLCRWEESERHFEDALEMNERLEARAYRAQICKEYGAVLLARGRRADLRRARDLLGEAMSLADTFGLGYLQMEIPPLLQTSRGEQRVRRRA